MMFIHGVFVVFEFPQGKLQVSASEVPNPVAVRYAFKDFVMGNLFNTERFPASVLEPMIGKNSSAISCCLVYWKSHILPRMTIHFLGSLPAIYPILLELLGMKDKIPYRHREESLGQYHLTANGEKPSGQYILGAIVSNNVNTITGFRGIRTTDYKLAFVKKK